MNGVSKPPGTGSPVPTASVEATGVGTVPISAVFGAKWDCPPLFAVLKRPLGTRSPMHAQHEGIEPATDP